MAAGLGFGRLDELGCKVAVGATEIASVHVEIKHDVGVVASLGLGVVARLPLGVEVRQGVVVGEVVVFVVFDEPLLLSLVVVLCLLSHGRLLQAFKVICLIQVCSRLVGQGLGEREQLVRGSVRRIQAQGSLLLA